MVQAYLRGLLKPDYENGYRSRFRENLLLGAIACEQVAKSNQGWIQAVSSFASLFADPKQQLAEFRKQWRTADDLMEGLLQPVLSKEGKSLVEAYTALEQSGQLEQIRQRDFNIAAELTEE